MEGGDDELGWYSVWAQPTSTDEPPGLRPAMLHLRSVFDAPAFEPHVTVLGVGTHKLSRRQASLSLRTACRTLPPFSCRLTRPACGSTFYQCVYMLVDPSHEVLHANKLVEGVFETQQSNDGVGNGPWKGHFAGQQATGVSLLQNGLTKGHFQPSRVLRRQHFSMPIYPGAVRSPAQYAEL